MTASTPAPATLRIQILQVPDCPLVDQLRTRLEGAMRHAGLQTAVETVTGPYPSPTLLIDGIDIATGRPPTRHPACRLDLPSSTQIIAALQKGTIT